MKRIYLDSNVFISLFQREIGKHERGLFVETEEFIAKVKENEDILVLSNRFFGEIENRHLSKKEALEFLLEKQVLFELIEEKEEVKIKEFMEKGIHASGSVHIAIAVKNKCDCIVTFNLRDFIKAKDRIEILSPEEFR